MVAPFVCTVLALFGSFLAPQSSEPEPARFVRVSLPTRGLPLSLAEVDVVSGGVSIAVGKRAEQSSTSNAAGPERAVDGDVNGVFLEGSVTHTIDNLEAWWEVDLGKAYPIDRVVVWNRTDCCSERLEGFTLQLFDARHKLLWERLRAPEPKPSLELIPFTAQPPPPSGPTVQERSRFQPNIDKAIDDGVDFLVRTQLWDGSYTQEATNYPAGATGLVLYTLLKSKVPEDHPAVQRALAYVLASDPRETYELGTVLMGLAALAQPHSPEVRAFLQKATDKLLDSQGAKSNDGRKEALWAYPHHVDIADLSNSQYAALGLRAAQRAGLDVPDRVWKKLAEAVLRYQEEPRKVRDPMAGSGSTTGELLVAGFSYRTNDQPPSASMTTAGLGILGLCLEGLGEGAGSLTRKLRPATRQALGWLTSNFTVRSNPGGGQNWLLYYLYGLERVGALHQVDSFGHHDWYWEGAKQIVGDQAGNGSWSSDNVADTCFALLFLGRATASASTGDSGASPEGTWTSESPDLDISWRILGGAKATFFLSGFSELVRKELATGLESGPESSLGLHVQRVEYLVDGAVVATLPGTTGRVWSGERFAVQHEFRTAGNHACQVRVLVDSPDVGQDGTATEWLTSEVIEVQVLAVPDPRLLAYPRHGQQNLLRGTVASSKATSEDAGGREATRAVDDQLGTAWVCLPEDTAPKLELELASPVKGRVLMVAFGNASEGDRGRYDRPTKLRIELRGRKLQVLEVDVPPRDEEKLVVELDKALALRGLSIEVLERTTGSSQPGRAAIAEVQWLAEL
ncbi:MAG: discoidin domain-containing protein [Planctomycetota bacterium]|nr:discoidin domain-containing protein [Planctomycetota bacterium]